MVSKKAPLPIPNQFAQVFREAVAFQKSGRLNEAGQRYGAILASDPKHFETLHLFGVLCAQQGKLEEGIELLRRAVDRNPASAEALNNLGITLIRIKRYAEAIQFLEKAIAINPGSAKTYCNLGNVLVALGRPREAVSRFEKAIALKSDFAEALSNLGAVWHTLGRNVEAVESLEKSLAFNPNLTESRHNLGIAFAALDRFDEAIECFKIVLASNSRNGPAWVDLGGAYFVLGRFEEASRCYEKALELEPDNARFHCKLAQAKKYGPDDPHIAAMEALVRRGGSTPADVLPELNFALAKAHEDLREYERAFTYILEGNALKRRRIEYDEAATLALFEEIRATFTPDFMRDRAGAGCTSDSPIFILGMPRSGSTLIEQILASHPSVFAGGERPDFLQAFEALVATGGAPVAYPLSMSSISGAQLREVGAAYAARAESWKTGGPTVRVTNKLPQNFLYIGLIHLALPNARIIHARRNPIDTCLSCFSKFFSGNYPFAYDLGELGRYWRGYAHLMEHWHDVLPAGAILDVDHQRLVEDFEGEVRRILTYCGLEWDDACVSFHTTKRPVRTSSALQVRKPLFSSSTRWRPHVETLRPLLEGLGDG
jgi:tetratricopeptide (TPR) repeat protein